MTKATRKPQQSRGVAMRFASRKNGTKKTLCQRRGRGRVKARNMTMRVRRPLQSIFRKKIRSYATQSKKSKKTRKTNCFFSRCGCKKSNRSRKRYQSMRQSQGRRQNPKGK
ncbi:spermatid nuclear transition protein 3-like [Dama dama]|uniref:spermatid nuclear transition protein 3-like n=1 Tax=Dama dama TaxID=30532 RepID=UPI002A362A61|nr:spermatid nuclear transition protein 3-like [Dama dama]